MPPVSDGLSWKTPAPNFDADSEALLQEFEEDAMEEESDDKAVPDSKLEMDENG